jgi:hypothetical protein
MPVPPSRHKKLTLNFEKDSVLGSHFTLTVNANITVAQLKREISIEEGVEVTRLTYLSSRQRLWRNYNIVVPTLQDLDDGTLISEYSLQDQTIMVYCSR